MKLNTKTLFFVALIVAASGFISPPLALALGIAYGLSFVHPFHMESRQLAKFLLQASVVALGFGMNLHQVLKAGREGFIYTALSITFALTVGLTLGKLLKVKGTASFLIATGTAICGGSAIAAVGPIAQANDEEMAVSLGTVFVLNSAALLLFPLIGLALHLSQQQFGLWAALAIHDTSSVVGAAAKYGAIALVVGTTVKLARALWIVPLSFATAAVKKSRSRVQIPWFIALFCLAAVVNTYLPSLMKVSASLSQLGKLGLTATLFLIGTGISRSTIKQVGWRPFAQGIALWAIIAVGSLLLIRHGFIAY
jgi:uncharacterized integral membrane protein (TIGR00698 family)